MYRAMLLLLGAFALLWAIGTVNVFSATFAEDRLSGSAYGHLLRQLVFSAVGLIPAVMVFRSDYHRLSKYSKLMYVVTLLLLLAVPLIGIEANGARRWLGVGKLTFQPSELAKLTAILCTASLLTPMLKAGKEVTFLAPLSHNKKAPVWQRFPWWPQKALLFTLVLAVPVFKQPDAGTAIIILTLPVLMVWISGAKLMEVKWPALLVAAGAVSKRSHYSVDRSVGV